YLMLFALGVLFVPDTWRSLRARLDATTAVAAIAFFGLYLLTFENSHPYNQAPFQWYLRNRLLGAAAAWPAAQALFLLPVALGTAVLYDECRTSGAMLLATGFSVAYLATTWLVEPRYLLIPLALFILFRRRTTPLAEGVELLLFAFLSVLVVR